MSEKWKLVWVVVGWCRCWNPDMQHSSLSLCLKSLSQTAPLLHYQLASSLLLVLILSWLCVWLPAWVGPKLINLLPMSDSSSIETQHFCYFARVFFLNSGTKCEFLCKTSSAPWLWSCSNFFLCWLTQQYFSPGIWGHTKPYCSHKFEMHTHDNLFHW
jgi:hypothetical protein